MEKTTHKLKIAGEEYRIVSTEAPEYMNEIAREIDLKIDEILKKGRISTTQAAVLVALQYADEAKKDGGASEALRKQMKACLEDAAQAKSERDALKRELERVKAAANGYNNGGSGLWG